MLSILAVNFFWKFNFFEFECVLNFFKIILCRIFNFFFLRAFPHITILLKLVVPSHLFLSLIFMSRYSPSLSEYSVKWAPKHRGFWAFILSIYSMTSSYTHLRTRCKHHRREKRFVSHLCIYCLLMDHCVRYIIIATFVLLLHF